LGKLRRSINHTDLRGGYTTGACAAATARAAVRMLIRQEVFTEIEIELPNSDLATFTLCRLEGTDIVTAGVIKDAGDDPDCTHGVEIQCKAKWCKEQGIYLKGGEGVATVTRPGLELPVGESAINPIPKANILEMVRRELKESNACINPNLGLDLEIVVPRGLEISKETISERLGLIGGISILGTRGTVKPYSTSAFAASVRQSVQVAKANGLDHVVLTTGSRSEKAAKVLFPALSEMAFIQAGDFIGMGLRGAKRVQLSKVSLVVMIGKMGKLVSGRMMTHVSGHAIDFNYLRKLAEEEGVASALCNEIAIANTGRHVLDLVRDVATHHFLTRLCKETHHHANVYSAEALDIEVTLIDFDGTRLASYPSRHTDTINKAK